MATKRVTVHYRRIVGGGYQTLAPEFHVSFAGGLESRIAGERLIDKDVARITTTSDSRRMCLLEQVVQPSVCFGEIAIFRDGDIAVAETAADGQVHLKTITLGGNSTQVQGSSYFMVKGEHVAMIHQESSGRFVEEYFRWILRQPIGPVAQDEIIRLVPFAVLDGQLVGLQQVRSLKLHAAVDNQVHIEDFLPDSQNDRRRPETSRKTLQRKRLGTGMLRTILESLGLSHGALMNVSDADLEDVEVDLLVRKRDRRRLDVMPPNIIQAVVNDGLEQAAEFGAKGTRRIGDAVIVTFPGDVELDGPYYDVPSVRNVLWRALGAWADQGII